MKKIVSVMLILLLTVPAMALEIASNTIRMPAVPAATEEPETTPEPGDTDPGAEGEVPPEETEVEETPAVEETDEAENEERSVTISMSIPENGTVTEGTIVTLTATPVGFEETPAIHWQKDTGSGFADIPGATGMSYSFAITFENMNDRYRARIEEE